MRTWCMLAVLGLGYAGPVAAQTQTRPCTADARRVVAEVYQRVLERSFDSGGQTFVDQLSGGQATVRDTVRAIAKHSEHRQRFLSGDRDAAVRALYRHLLGREGDDGGVAQHLKAAASQGIDPVIDALLDSGEYAERFGDFGVPGSGLRYCGPTRGSTAEGGGMRFQGMDANRNGLIERREWTGSATSFGVHDWNGDGVLSQDEVRRGGRRAERRPDEVDYNPSRPGAFEAWDETGFSRLDRNRDGRLAANEWYFDTESFVRADRNRDGTLSRGEFLDAYGSMDDDRDDRFDDLDVDRNGRVERHEWHASADAFTWLDRNRDQVLSRAEVLGTATANSQFSRLDADGNGRLSVEEWQWSRRSFTRQDVNGDGTLSESEFANQPAGR